MKCPHCDYEDGWSGEKMKTVEGGKGHFYEHKLAMERQEGYHKDERGIYGCPNCGKLFINMEW